MNADDDIFAGLEDIFDEVDEEEYEDLTQVPTMELLDRFQALTEALKDEKQAWFPRTRDARDRHSIRYALQLELRSRGMPV